MQQNKTCALSVRALNKNNHTLMNTKVQMSREVMEGGFNASSPCGLSKDHECQTP